jgi:cobaltochelatase CobT
VEVAWTSDQASQTGKLMRVPMPGRALPADQVAQARGAADSMALRLRHHNEALHNAGAPGERSPAPVTTRWSGCAMKCWL